MRESKTRRVGLSNKSKPTGLLKQIEGKPRDAWNADTAGDPDEIDDPEDYDDNMTWYAGKEYGRVGSAESGTTSDLRSGARRRQPSGQDSADAQKRRRIQGSDSNDEVDSLNVSNTDRKEQRAKERAARNAINGDEQGPAAHGFSASGFIAGVTSGYDDKEAIRRASSQPKPYETTREAGRMWQDGNRKPQKVYGKSRLHNGASSSQRSLARTDSNVSDSSSTNNYNDKIFKQTDSVVVVGKTGSKFRHPGSPPKALPHLKSEKSSSSDSDSIQGSPPPKPHFRSGRGTEATEREKEPKLRKTFRHPSQHDLPPDLVQHSKPKKKFQNPSSHDLLDGILEQPKASKPHKFIDPSRHGDFVTVLHTQSSSDELGSENTQTTIAVPGKRTRKSRLERSQKQKQPQSRSPSEEPAMDGSQQISDESQQIPPSSGQQRAMDELSKFTGRTGLNDHENQSTKKPGEDYCEICDEILPRMFREKWSKRTGSTSRMEMCLAHKQLASETAWKERGYPKINFQKLPARTKKYLPLMKDIIDKRMDSPCYRVFEEQTKQLGGRVTKLLTNLDEKLQYPGYYGPRGSSIILQYLTAELGTKVGNVSGKDPVMARVGVSGFIQSVLVPEVGVRLIMEDMDVDEKRARVILAESQEAGEQLHLDDEGEDDIYDDGGDWVDVNATMNQELLDEQRREEREYGYDSDE